MEKPNYKTNNLTPISANRKYNKNNQIDKRFS